MVVHLREDTQRYVIQAHLYFRNGDNVPHPAAWLSDPTSDVEYQYNFSLNVSKIICSVPSCQRMGINACFRVNSVCQLKNPPMMGKKQHLSMCRQFR